MQPKLLEQAFLGRFSKPAARVGLNLASISYHQPREAGRRLEALGWRWAFVSKYGVDCYVLHSLEDSDLSAIVVRGSQFQPELLWSKGQFGWRLSLTRWLEQSDWVKNLMVRKTSVNGTPAYSHAGYSDAWKFIREKVVPLVEGNKIALIGHSAGGAIAIEGLLDYLTSSQLPARPSTYALYTYGTPGTLNRHARNLLKIYSNNQFWRIVNQVDLFADIGLSYHAGELVYLSDDRIYYPPHNGARLLADKAIAHLTYKPGERVTDHLISGYARSMNRSIGLQGTDFQASDVLY